MHPAGQVVTEGAQLLPVSNLTSNIMNRIILYIIGTLLVAGGGAWMAVTLGAPPVWVGVGCLIIVGLGFMGAAGNARGNGGSRVTVNEDNDS